MKKLKMKFIHKKCIILAVLFVLVCGGITYDVPAAVSGNEPILYYAEPSNGSVGVATTVTIDLAFTHNVSSAQYQEKNAKAITVSTDDGEVIPAQIVFSPDFIYRQHIYVKLADLYPNMAYNIRIDGTLTAANSSESIVEQVYTFTTGDAPKDAHKDQVYDDGTKSEQDDTGDEEDVGSEPQDTEQEDLQGEPVSEDDTVLLDDNNKENNPGDTEEISTEKEDGKQVEDTEQADNPVSQDSIEKEPERTNSDEAYTVTSNQMTASAASGSISGEGMQKSESGASYSNEAETKETESPKSAEGSTKRPVTYTAQKLSASSDTEGMQKGNIAIAKKEGGMHWLLAFSAALVLAASFTGVSQKKQRGRDGYETENGTDTTGIEESNCREG